MTKQELKTGMVVEYRNGTLRLVVNDYLYSSDGYIEYELFYFNDDLLDKDCDRDFDIVAVYNSFDKSKCLWKRKEIKITEAEKVILKHIDKKFKYIARDSDNDLFVYQDKPNKSDEYLDCVINTECNTFKCFNHLFSFIKWEDEKPYLIEDLLKM